MQEESKISHNIVFLGEEDFIDKMTNVVCPLLDANRESGYFQSYDNTKIYYEYYINPDEKAAIVISHGFCEFTSKYEEVIYYFFQAGYSVFILDHRGHGYSEREVEDICKVHVHSYDEYVLDLHHYIHNIVLKHCICKKLVLYGHSMGGAISALYLEQYPKDFSCAILTSPMLQIHFGKFPEFFAQILLSYAKIFKTDGEYVRGHKGFDGIAMFEDSSCLSEARYQYIFTKRQQNSNYQTYGATSAWTLSSLKGVRKLHKYASLVKTPILLFQAENDTVVKPGGQNRFYMKSKNTKLVVIKDSKHEIYNADDKIRELYYHQMFEFIETYV